jgi:hypothetical protein
MTFWQRGFPLGSTASMEDWRSSSKSTSTKIRAYDSLSFVDVSLSHCIGFPRTLASLDKHLDVQHYRGKFGNFTQTRTWVITEQE